MAQNGHDYIVVDSVATLKKSKTLDGPLKKPQKSPGQICKDFAEKSKTLDGPLKKPQKSPGQICKDFAEKSNFSWKKSNFFSKKSNFLGKNRTFFRFFLVINSDSE